MANKYRHLGKSTPRLDAEDIVTGAAKYIDDLKMPGMLHGKALRSPYPHAIIASIDTSKAEKLPGVEAVVTYKNTLDLKEMADNHIHVLSRELRCVGDTIALVAAKTVETAEQALDLIEVEYEQLPVVYDAEEAMQPGAPQLYTEFPGNVLPPNPKNIPPNMGTEIILGDIENGLQEADFVTEGTYGYENYPNPLPPEPPGAVAKWLSPNKLMVWSSTQCPYFVKRRIEAAIGTGDVDVQSIGVQCGGGYGTKIFSIMPIYYAVALAKAAGENKPVKFVFTKEEHFTNYIVRFGSRLHGKVGMKKDGTVTAFSGNWIINAGCRSQATPMQVSVGLGEAQVMLRSENWDLKSHIVLTNRNAAGEVRGFGGQELKSAFIPLLTIGMEEANIDPVNFFKKNYAKAGDGYLWHKTWVDCRGIDYSKAIEKGAEAFGWQDKWRGWGKPTAAAGTKRIGVGCAVHGNADTGEGRSEAWVKLVPDGNVMLQLCVAEPGGGQRSSLRKMVAEVLNLPLDKVSITPPDTLINPYEQGLTGSRGTYSIGSAATRAAEDAMQKLFEMAAPKLGVRPQDLETKDGIISVKNKPDARLDWFAAMDGMDGTITGTGSFEPDRSVPNFFMLFVEIEVDTETGDTKLLRVLGATDVGQIIDPLSLENQIHGAIGSAGIDTALYEETVIDEKTGHTLSGNMIDYKWRTFVDLPEFDKVILENPLPTHIFKAVGVGEITSSPGPSAVLMAISNAIGMRVTEYPATPDRILRILEKLDQKG